MAGFAEAPVAQIAELMRNQRSIGSSVCMLLGAGVSVSSGIPDANGIMDDLRDKFTKTVATATEETYSAYMSTLVDGVRRRWINNYLRRAKLNSSAIAVARLAGEGYVDRILTTNFDELIERALTMLNCTSTVHDFASSHAFNPGEATGLRLFYLHGRAKGFLLLNTAKEIASLSRKLTPLFRDSNTRRAWVIVGYSGRDRPVFDAIRNLNGYDFGLFWVGYRRQSPSDRVQRHLLSRPNAFFVRTDDSDQFFDELLNELGVDFGASRRPKTRVALEDIDRRLTSAGRTEAADLFGVKRDGVEVLAFRVFHEKTKETYLHRVFVRKDDLIQIADELENDPTTNIIRSLVTSRGISLHNRKSHRFIPTTVGDDARVLEEHVDSAALLHAQISYAEPTAQTIKETGMALEPVELLLTKYTRPVSVCGYLLDRTPKKGFAYSKSAEDLLSRKAYRREVTDAVAQFYYPFSHLALHFAREEEAGAHTLPSSGKPDRLLRIAVVPEDVCNYDCTFCCQTRRKRAKDVSTKGTIPQVYGTIAQAAAKSGCSRIMLTGGEPLLCARERLLGIVESIRSVPDISDFWICSNGSKLGGGMAHQLKRAGLEKIVVTIGAETPDKYATYTRQTHCSLQRVFDNVKGAVDAGLQVRVDVPLSRDGVKNYVELLKLVEEVKALGVKDIAYFRLHQTDENAEVFDDLFVSQDIVTSELARDNAWQIVAREGQRRAFFDGHVEVIIPTRIRPESGNCRKHACERRCQGIYAAYAEVDESRLVVRACHRKLEGNTVRIPRAQVRPASVDDLAQVFSRQIWSWAYKRKGKAGGGDVDGARG